MSKKTNKRMLMLAGGMFIAFAPGVYAGTMRQQEPNPDTLKQDEADRAQKRATRTQDDIRNREMVDQIHKLEAERHGLYSQIAGEKRVLHDAQAKYAADQKSHASADQLAKDRSAIEQAKAAVEKDVLRAREYDQKIVQLKKEFASADARRNSDTEQLKVEQNEVARDQANARGKGNTAEEVKDRNTRNQDDRILRDLGDQIHKLQAERSALNGKLATDKRSLNDLEAKYAADQKSHASSAQLEKDRLAAQQARDMHQKDVQRAQEIDQKIAQLKSRFAEENAKRNNDTKDLKQ